MKYRRLSLDELKELEKEFTQFLAAQSIEANDWDQMKQENPDRVEELIGEFSDIVFDKVLGKIEYLEHRSAKELKIFHFNDDHIELAGLTVDPSNETIDLTNQQVIDQLAKDFESMANEGDVKIFTSEKPYSKEKKEEIFELSESGCYVVDGSLFKTLKQLKSEGT